jgi:hypothetical protein
MNPEDIITRIEALEQVVRDLQSGNSIPLWLDQALVGRGFLKAFLTGIIQGNGKAALTAIIPLSGIKTYYVSDSNGGTVNRKLTFTNGVLTAQT